VTTRPPDVARPSAEPAEPTESATSAEPTASPPTEEAASPPAEPTASPPTEDAADEPGPGVTGEARFIGVVRLPVDPDPEPARPGRGGRAGRAGGVIGHRRRLPPAVPRRLRRTVEATAWAAGLAVLAGIATFLVGGSPQPGHAFWVDPVWTVTPVPGGGPCVFEPCVEPTYTGEPTRLRIASIGVDAGLEQLALDSKEQLTPPKSYTKAGWWREGVLPGEAGPAVVAGHVDSYTGPAVFYRLHTLRSGDVIEVQRGGAWISFEVTSVERYAKNRFPTAKVYRPTPGAELRLITCGGDFDSGPRSYRDNIVVYAVLAI
jgi:hypothetical protein